MIVTETAIQASAATASELAVMNTISALLNLSISSGAPMLCVTSKSVLWEDEPSSSSSNLSAPRRSDKSGFRGWLWVSDAIMASRSDDNDDSVEARDITGRREVVSGTNSKKTIQTAIQLHSYMYYSFFVAIQNADL